jgi:hypothetical protein
VITNGFDVNDPSQWAFINATHRRAGFGKSACVRSSPTTPSTTPRSASPGSYRCLPAQGRRPVQGIHLRDPRRASRVRTGRSGASGGHDLADLTKSIGLEDISNVGDSTWLIPDMMRSTALQHLQ